MVMRNSKITEQHILTTTKLEEKPEYTKNENLMKTTNDRYIGIMLLR